MQNNGDLSWKVETKNDVLVFKNELRKLFGSHKGDGESGPQVPFSLEMSQSFREFKIKCYQYLNCANFESTFHVRLDPGYLISFNHGTVDLKIPTIIAKKTDDWDPEQDQDDADI